MAVFASRLAASIAVASVAAAAAVSTAYGQRGATDWPSTNYDQTANRYSPLTQITRQNVSTLQRVWSIHLKPPAIRARCVRTKPSPS
jgi:glucose dehydrogenase